MMANYLLPSFLYDSKYIIFPFGNFILLIFISYLWILPLQTMNCQQSSAVTAIAVWQVFYCSSQTFKTTVVPTCSSFQTLFQKWCIQSYFGHLQKFVALIDRRLIQLLSRICSYLFNISFREIDLGSNGKIILNFSESLEKIPILCINHKCKHTVLFLSVSMIICFASYGGF